MDHAVLFGDCEEAAFKEQDVADEDDQDEKNSGTSPAPELD